MENEQAEIEAVNSAWPDSIAKWDAWEAAGRPIWEEMTQLQKRAVVAKRRLERLGESVPAIRVPDVAQGEFPFKAGFSERMRWTPEAARAEWEQRQADSQRQREWREHFTGQEQTA